MHVTPRRRHPRPAAAVVHKRDRRRGEDQTLHDDGGDPVRVVSRLVAVGVQLRKLRSKLKRSPPAPPDTVLRRNVHSADLGHKLGEGDQQRCGGVDREASDGVVQWGGACDSPLFHDVSARAQSVDRCVEGVRMWK
eukprot:CAMPEP_0202826792 /NCGR_PEP_ID=MMETSP1389-20130828/13845_1 /ASSEMBLY_ACC=CAM_ASM_000865 /TAXON_ID=302021 /ORGANISM="Rhodomonas sp., Strain CCMP768" /LENGTH=135 /DNA_ID=CAMNT_0049500131 /DNA_START=125 /DNA_END=532 /DNA_ORIENTATION=+